MLLVSLCTFKIELLSKLLEWHNTYTTHVIWLQIWFVFRSPWSYWKPTRFHCWTAWFSSLELAMVNYCILLCSSCMPIIMLNDYNYYAWRCWGKSHYELWRNSNINIIIYVAVCPLCAALVYRYTSPWWWSCKAMWQLYVQGLEGRTITINFDQPHPQVN